MNYYSVSDILHIESDKRLPFLDLFQTHIKLKTDIEVTHTKHTNEGRKIGLRYTYEDRFNMLSYRFKHLGITIGADIFNLEGQITSINFLPSFLNKRLPSPYTEKSVVESIIQLKLIQKGFALVPMACVSSRGEGICLLAFSDTGKTTTTFSLCKNGYKYLSDDRAVIDSNGYVYSYPTPCTITKNIEKLSVKKKIELKFRSLLSKILPLTIIDPSVKVSPFDFVCEHPNLRAEVDTIFVLQKGENKVKTISSNYTTNVLYNLTRYEMNWLTHPFIITYALANPSLNLSKLITKERDIIDRFVISTSDHYEITSPISDFSPEIIKIIGTPRAYRKLALANVESTTFGKGYSE